MDKFEISQCRCECNGAGYDISEGGSLSSRTFEKKPIGVLNSQCTLGLNRSGTSACTWSFFTCTQL